MNFLLGLLTAKTLQSQFFRAVELARKYQITVW